MNSPTFCCPECGSREWWKEELAGIALWTCKHPQSETVGNPAQELTAAGEWTEYVFEEEGELLSALKRVRQGKEEKTAAGKASLTETIQIRALEIRLSAQEQLCQIALCLPVLSEVGSGVLELKRQEKTFRFKL